MSVEDYEVEGALKSLMQKGWVIEWEKEGGRTRRYAHAADKQLAVGKAEIAILAELLNRGPQTPTELKARASRMHPLPGPDDVERRLGEMASRPVPYVKRLAKQPREHAPRWTHLLGPTPSPSAPASPPEGSGDRIAALETRVASLEERLDRLEGR
jgi:uncharacterized protein YceH (UPF0502 family)